MADVGIVSISGNREAQAAATTRDPRPFLGVETSLTGRRWEGPGPEEERLCEAMVQRTGLPDAVARILCRAGVAPEAAEDHLAPTLRALLPDPLELRDMERAAARLIDALDRGERIAIFGDYDVDGGASAAMMVAWLREMGHGATLYIPDRIDEGYGPNDAAMAMLARDHGLIVCVDCGTLSHGPIAAAAGADVIVLDHHLGAETLPPALAVVNPNRQDESGTLAHLCAAGVVFLLLVQVTRMLRPRGGALPDLKGFLDLVALATVADVAPLHGVNRAFVRQGLGVMAARARPGLVALADIAGLEVAPAAYHLGYVLGPRINAGGRIGRADLGARLLSATDPQEAARIAAELDRLNGERRAVEAEVRDAALAQAEARGLDAPLVWAAGAGWHPGVVGIVAARLKEATGRPAVVIGCDGGIGKGSGRSVAGVDLGAAIQRLAAEGLLLRGGGHRMAAGLTVAEDAIAPAMERLAELLARQGAGDRPARGLRIAGLITPGAATPELLERIERAGPFGQDAPAPRFALADCRVLEARRVGETHLRLALGDGTGGRLGGIAFNVGGTPLGDALEGHGGRRFHVAGRLELNHYRGRAIPQIRVEDAAPA
ncbi:single-stranded-DNA-specific exonuclease RecJ [Palleronia sediminis]|uniref:Single-stranded-DNA-specific exonuclease RecJ n=1 Tax=Palleronia sediminis TaxID=2547833 RepID=A0A4R6AE21_9RHOB|nr:single-stranded-DNA-specific exonuclease RecJ [Palleronia sediminis]TDL79453.1 single-stranded-DNA-specific exonuclease RecJ [Palleronia sediminis]